MGKKFNQFLRQAAAQGIYVGDINQATAAFQGGGYPTPPAEKQAPPPAPDPIKRNTNPRRVGDTDDGGSLKIKRKSKRRRQQQAKGTGQLRINPTSVANTSTAAQAASSGGINV